MRRSRRFVDSGPGELKADGAESSDGTQWHGERASFALASEGNPRQGRMRRHRVITTAAFLALAVPAAAQGSSLLSGYGGPGQGNQAILGATVIGGGASGGSTGSGSSASSGSGGSGLALSPTPSTSPTTAKAQSHSHGKAHRAGRATKRQDRASTSPPNAYRATSTLSANETASVATPTLGISGADLVYILVAFGALALTGAITGRLVRRPH